MIFFRRTHMGGEDYNFVILDMNDGSQRSEVKPIKSYEYTLPAAHPFEALPNCTFKGWALSRTGEIIQAPTVTFTGNHLCLFGRYNVKVTYDPNGGTGTSFFEERDQNESFIVPTDDPGFVPPSGTEFDGWSLTPDGEKIDGPISLLGPITLYAHWKNIS